MDQQSEKVIEQIASQTEIDPKELTVPHKVHHFITKKTLIVMLAFLIIVITTVAATLYAGSKAEKTAPAPAKPNKETAKLSPLPTSVSINATPTPNPTALWKTYTNEEYGFSVKYPPDREVTLLVSPSPATPVSPQKADFLFSTTTATASGTTQSSDIVFTIGGSQVSSADAFDGLIKKYQQQPWEDQILTSTLLDGIQAVVVSGTNNGRKQKEFAVIHQGIEYTLTAADESIVVLNKMLTTFKFISPTSKVPQPSDQPEQN